jgi:glutaredoxin
MQFKHVKGINKGDIIFYGLSTCVWCKKTKLLLDRLGCDYKYIYVDQLNQTDKEETLKKIIKWNPRSSFPTILINNEKCIVGYKEDEIREALNL